MAVGCCQHGQYHGSVAGLIPESTLNVMKFMEIIEITRNTTITWKTSIIMKTRMMAMKG
jgi:hypothetical protein